MFVINKAAAARTVDVRVDGVAASAGAEVYRFSGEGEADMAPEWERVGEARMEGAVAREVVLPGTSITVVDFRPGG